MIWGAIKLILFIAVVVSLWHAGYLQDMHDALSGVLSYAVLTVQDVLSGVIP